MIKTYLKSYAYLLSMIIIFTIILSILNYFLKFPVNIIKIIIQIISILISSYILGKNTKERAYLEGLKYSALYLLFITIIKLILKTNFNYKVIIIYFLILFTGIIGAMIGINNQRKNI